MNVDPTGIRLLRENFSESKIWFNIILVPQWSIWPLHSRIQGLQRVVQQLMWICICCRGSSQPSWCLCSCSLAQVSQGGEVLCGEKQRLPNLHLSPQSSFLTLPPSLPPCTADNKYLLEKNSTNFGGISFLCHRRPFVFLLLDLLLLNLAFTNSKLLPSHGSWVPTQWKQGSSEI